MTAHVTGTGRETEEDASAVMIEETVAVHARQQAAETDHETAAMIVIGVMIGFVTETAMIDGDARHHVGQGLQLPHQHQRADVVTG